MSKLIDEITDILNRLSDVQLHQVLNVLSATTGISSRVPQLCIPLNHL